MSLCFDAPAFELTHKEDFSRDKIKISDIELEGVPFSSVDYDVLLKTNTVGEARLPFKILEFEVPSDIHSFTLACEYSGEQAVPHGRRVEICQEDILSSSGGETTPKFRDTYSSDIFPAEGAKIVEDGYRMGDIHILHVAVYPFRYDANSNELTFTESVVLKIKDASASSMAKVSGQNVFTSVLRPLKISESATGRSNIIGLYRPRPYVGDSLPVYEYAVITSRELAPEFDRIIGLKKQKGLDAGVVCIEDILKDPAFAKGDTISGINDNAGKLRAFLMACRQLRTGDMFVLLGGNQNIIPVRNAYEDTEDTKHYIINGVEHPYRKRVPTDWYYTDLNGNWDYNKNSLYGEFDDKKGMDFNPDIYIGRICCKNKLEVENYTYKLIKYEMNPGNGDFSYLRQMISMQADHMQKYDQAKASDKKCKTLFDKHTIFQEKPSFDASNPTEPTGTEIIDSINTYNYGFINLLGHGGVVSITVKAAKLHLYNWYNILSMQSLPDRYTSSVREKGNGLDMLRNYDFPSICYTTGCDVMPYDNMVLTYDTIKQKDGIFELPPEIYNFGDSFTIGGRYGGPAFIGNTRYGWVIDSFEQEKVFLNLLNTDGCLGRIRAKTQSIFHMSHHCRLTNNLLGCPEFKMWIKTPTTIDISYQSYQSLTTRTFTCDSDVKVSGISVSNGYVVPYTGTLSDGKQKISVPGENCVVTLTGDYKIPFRMPLMLNNVSVNADGYYYVTSVGTSKATRPSSIGFNKARVTFDATGPIEINQDVTVDNGSDVTFISPELVKLTNLKVKNKSKVTIICDKGYTVEGTCDCELGSELIIKQK